MIKQTVFISRNLQDDSLFYSSFNKHILIKAYSLLEFFPIPFSDFPSSDFIFFYSRNAIHFFFSQLKNKEVNAKLCCMGKGTQNALESLGYPVYFTGAGNLDEIANSFLDFSKNKRVLFPRAKQSQKSIQQRILGEAEVLDLVVYNNQKKTLFPHPNSDILVFTSPLNVESYFDCHEHQGEILIAIGNTTKKKLHGMGFENVKRAKENSEQALVEVVKTVINDK